MYSTETLDTLFGALSNRTRREIIKQLSLKQQSVVELVERFSISQPAITKHLNVLEKSGLIERQREGRLHICVLKAESLEEVYGWVGYFDSFWNKKLEALSKHVEAKNG